MSISIALVCADAAIASARAEQKHAWWLYAQEIFDHQRTPYHLASAAEVTGDRDVAVVSTAMTMDVADARRLRGWVEDGGTLVIVGDPGHLAEACDLEVLGPVDHGHVQVLEHELWTRRPEAPLHAVGGVRLGTDPAADLLATWDDGSTAIAQHHRGRGTVLAVGVDLWQSVVRIQQGYPVLEDGQPAQDGTAPLDEGILKAEDGMALSLEEDRAMPAGEPELSATFEHTYPPPSAVPVFQQPHADHWRSILHQLLWWHAQEAGSGLPWLHYWPAGVPAIAHMSHDADMNCPEDALAALDAFDEADVKVTWCQVHPGGYGSEIHAMITAAGHENALHYNAMGDTDLASWGWPQMRAQYAWAQAVTGEENIVANKNHYTRWEGWTEFYSWCETLGIQIDESRGPSKQGTVGFPFGTAHVSFPLGDLDVDNRLMDVISLPLHTQDLAWAGHLATRDVVLGGAEAQHGVAHFLYHGPHLRMRPATRASCPELAQLARERGMQWWTARQINSWERARRTVDLEVDPVDGGWSVRANSSAVLDRAAILLPVSATATVGGYTLVGTGDLDIVVRHGRRFLELAVDLEPGDRRWLITAR